MKIRVATSLGLLGGWLLMAGLALAEEDIQALLEKAERINLTASLKESRAWLDSISDRLERGSDVQKHQAALISVRLHALAGEYTSALQELDWLLDQSLRADHRLRALELAANVGLIHGDYERGFSSLNKAMNLLDQVDDPGLRSGVLGLASFWHAHLGDRQKGLEYAELTMELAEQSRDERERCVALEKLGQAQKMAGFKDEALASYQQGLEACKQAEDPVFTGIMKILTGRLLHLRGDLEEGEAWLREGLQETRQAGFQDGVLDGSLSYVELLLDLGRRDEADELLASTARQLERRNRLARLADAYLLKARLHRENGEFQQAFRTLDDHLDLREQVLDQERGRLIAFYEIEIDATRRNQELALLREQAHVAELRDATTQQQLRLRQAGMGLGSLLLVGLILLLLQSVRERRHFRALSQTDPLTGLDNHTRFFEQAEKELEECEQQGRPAVLVLADIDHFKKINDEHGHLVGDRVLRSTSSQCRAAFPPSCLLGRIGGEEFAVLLPDHDIHQAHKRLESLRRATRLQSDQEQSPSVTISFGLAQRLPAESLQALRGRADQALYVAKSAGRDRIQAAAVTGQPQTND